MKGIQLDRSVNYDELEAQAQRIARASDGMRAAARDAERKAVEAERAARAISRAAGS